MASLTILHVKDAIEMNQSAAVEEINEGLTPQQELAKQYFLVMVLGKCNLHNYCLLNLSMKYTLDLLVRDRETVGITEKNPYAIPAKEDSFLRHSPILKDLADSLGVEHMQTKNMRKYLATTFQVSSV